MKIHRCIGANSRYLAACIVILNTPRTVKLEPGAVTLPNPSIVSKDVVRDIHSIVCSLLICHSHISEDVVKRMTTYESSKQQNKHEG